MNYMWQSHRKVKLRLEVEMTRKTWCLKIVVSLRKLSETAYYSKKTYRVKIYDEVTFSNSLFLIRKYQPAEPEYEVCWRVSETNESQTSYSVEQAYIFQYQSYSHSYDMFIILTSNINTDTSIFVFSREKLHDSKYSKDASPKP